MIRHCMTVWLMCLCAQGIAWNTFGETFALQDKACQRRLRVVRHYDISARKGAPTIAAIPAFMSFWGQTNWQIVKQSQFTYSEPPDKTEITSDNLGMPRRYYHLTWNSPKSDKLTVEQTLEVELSCFNTLYTTVKLPYPDDILKRFSASLRKDEKDGINPENKDLAPICDAIVKKSRTAEEVVENVCDWINENIKFVKGQRSSDEALAQRQGSCTPMSKLACAMLRRIGIPAEVVDGKFIGKDSSHAYMEVYFPDAGWVFYDLSNWNRGYKSLDCLMTVGWSYKSGTPDDWKWVEGSFCVEKDQVSFKDRSEVGARVIRKPPVGKKVVGVTVAAQKAPASVRVRQRPIRELILDTAVPPGTREYSDDAIGTPPADAAVGNP